RERRDDIPLLVAHFYRQFATGTTRPPKQLVNALSRLEWPGNGRGLRNAVQRAVLLDDPELWHDLSSAGDEKRSATKSNGASYQFEPDASFGVAKESAMADWESWYLRELMRRHDGNLSRAAQRARMSRVHLRALL